MARRVGIGVAVAALLGACATRTATVATGRDFPAAALVTLPLGQADEAAVESVLGAPLKRTAIKTVVTNPRFPLPVGTRVQLTFLSYYYAPASGGASAVGSLLRHSATVLLWDGVLSGYRQDRVVKGPVAPPFDEAKAALLRRASTTRPEAIALLGDPTGQARAPTDFPNHVAGTTLIIYSWGYQNRQEAHQRYLALRFNARDVMTDITEADTDGAGPSLLPVPIPVPQLPRGNEQPLPVPAPGNRT